MNIQLSSPPFSTYSVPTPIKDYSHIWTKFVTMSKSNTTGENDHPIVAIVSKETDTTLTSSDDAAQTSVTGSWLAKIIDSRYVQSNALSRHLAARVACYMKNRKQRSPPWVKTIIRFGPLSGIFTMLLTIASLVASLGILGT